MNSATYRAVLLNNYGGANAAQVTKVIQPELGPGQVMVKVRAAGVNGIDWKVREGYVRDAFPLQLPVVLGIELAGVVEAIGPGASRFQVGDRVMGPVGGLGAYADFVAVDETNLIATPDGLDDVRAAAVPVAAVAAWQSLYHAGPLRPGQRILVHGAAGGLGGYAVQYAKRAGAEVFATAASADIEYVRSLGADHVIDYQTQHFEELVQGIDLVLDYVGGEVLDRSWQVLAEGGVIVGTTSPDILARTPAGHRGLWFINKPDAALLQTLAADIHADKYTNVPHFTGKHTVERMIESLDLPVTILRPAYFMQNEHTVQQVIQGYGVYPMPIGSAGVAMVDTRDIADVAVAELLRRDQAAEPLPRVTLDLVGPERLTGVSAAQAWSAALGRDVAYGGDDVAAFEAQLASFGPAWLAYDMRLMMAGIQQFGMQGDAGAVERLQGILGRPLRTYADFVKEAVSAA